MKEIRKQAKYLISKYKLQNVSKLGFYLIKEKKIKLNCGVINVSDYPF